MKEVPTKMVKLPTQLTSKLRKPLNPETLPNSQRPAVLVSNPSQLSPQRQRVLQLLRKAKTRGDSLLLKCKKHPLPK